MANYSYARGSSDVAYWQLPERFLGRKTLAYGGELRVKLRYEGGGIYRDQEPDIILVGTRATLQHRFADKLSGMFAQQLTVRMFESSFVKADGLPSRREDFMLVLANLQAILIKATYVDDTELAAYVSMPQHEQYKITAFGHYCNLFAELVLLSFRPKLSYYYLLYVKRDLQPAIFLATLLIIDWWK